MAIDPHLRAAKVKTLALALADLSESQLQWMEEVMGNSTSEMFADALQIHHCFSTEALSKDRFEYAFDRVLNRCGIPSSLAGKRKPGHDITIRGYSGPQNSDHAIR
jgi:type II restriction enzyme